MPSRYPQALLHISWGTLRGVRSHAVDEAIFRHKARNGRLLRRKSLGGESGTQLAGLSDEAKTKDKDSLPTPLIHKRDRLLCEGVHATRWALVENLFLLSRRLLKQVTLRALLQNLGMTDLHDRTSLVLPEVLLSHHAIDSGQNPELVASGVMDATLDSTAESLVDALLTEAARVVELDLHFIL
jgi:hypothetical protein